MKMGALLNLIDKLCSEQLLGCAIHKDQQPVGFPSTVAGSMPSLNCSAYAIGAPETEFFWCKRGVSEGSIA